MPQTSRGPGLASTGNRVLLAVVLFFVVFVPTRSWVAGLVVAVVVYLLATVIARLPAKRSNRQ